MKKIIAIAIISVFLFSSQMCATTKTHTRGNSENAKAHAPGQQKK